MDDIGLGRIYEYALTFLLTLGSLGITGLVLFVVGLWKQRISTAIAGVLCVGAATYYALTVHTINTGIEILPPLLILAGAGAGIIVDGAWRKSIPAIIGGSLCFAPFFLGLSVVVYG